jgi:hypothetical protein
VQSANWKKYLVSGFKPVASILTVKSTSYEVNAMPVSTGFPDSSGDSEIANLTHTGTDSGDCVVSVTPTVATCDGTARVHSRTDVSKGSP